MSQGNIAAKRNERGLGLGLNWPAGVSFVLSMSAVPEKLEILGLQVREHESVVVLCPWSPRVHGVSSLSIKTGNNLSDCL